MFKKFIEKLKKNKIEREKKWKEFMALSIKKEQALKKKNIKKEPWRIVDSSQAGFVENINSS